MLVAARHFFWSFKMSFEINAKTRQVKGSSASRRLRRAGTVPGIVYGNNAPAQMIEMEHNAIYLALKKEAFHSAIIDLTIDGKKEQVLLRDFQTHAYKPRVFHVDFQRVDAASTLHTKVPVHFVNADKAPGIKLKGGILNQLVTELEIKCLAANLPEFIEVDLGSLNVGQSFHLKDVKLPKGVQLAHADDDVVLANIVAPSGAAEPEATAPAAEKPAS